MPIKPIQPFAFVLMPFSSDFKEIYRDGIKPIAKKNGLKCERADEQIFPEGILARIYAEIARADLIIADMTGCNPNVFYEVGFAHALNKPVILLTQSADDIPFDLKHSQHVVYKDIRSLRAGLTRAITHYQDHPPKYDRTTLHVPRVRRFETLTDVYAHVVHRMLRSRVIDDLSWAKPEVQEKSRQDRRGYEEYLTTKQKVCRRKDVSFREVFTFPTNERLARALNLIDSGLYGYAASYYPEKVPLAPRLSFTIFDSEEVVIFFYSANHRSARTEIRLSITERNLVSLFKDYYDNIFESGIILKDAGTRNEEELRKLRMALSESVRPKRRALVA